MSFKQERRREPRTELHRTWTLSVEGAEIKQRQAQVLDYSSSGMKLSLDGGSVIRPGEHLRIHYPGTNLFYLTTVVWRYQLERQTLIGIELIEARSLMQQAC